MALNCVSLVGKSDSGQFWGDGSTGRWKTTRVVDVTGYGALPSITSSGHLEAITINNVPFGTGRIISVERVGSQEFGGRNLGNQKFKAIVEIFIDGSLANTELPNASISNLSYLESFSESFSIEVDEQGGYRYSHSLSIKYIKADAGFDPIAAAKTAATAIFAGTSYDATIASLGQNFAYTRVGRKYFTEKYDTKTNECSFEKSYILLNRNTTTNYTLSLSSKVSINDIGAILVEEKGDIVGLNGFSSASAGVTTELAAAYARCNTLFTSTNNLVSGSFDNLINLPLQKLISFNSQAQTASYAVVYTNNKNLDTANSIIFEQTETFGKQGDIPSISYEGRITSFNKKSSAFNASTIITAKVPATPVGYKLLSKKFSASKFGKVISFNYIFTNDPTFYTSGTFRKIVISTEDQPGGLVHKEYMIPNSKIVIHNLEITSISKRTVSIDTVLPRTANVMTSPPVLPLTQLKDLALVKCLAFITELNLLNINNNMIFFPQLSYNFSSNRTLKMSLEMDYVVIKTTLTQKILQ